MDLDLDVFPIPIPISQIPIPIPIKEIQIPQIPIPPIKKEKPDKSKKLLQLSSVKLDDISIQKLLEILVRYENEKEFNKKRLEKKRLKLLNDINKKKEKYIKEKALKYERMAMGIIFNVPFNNITEDDYAYISDRYPDIKKVIDSYTKIDSTITESLRCHYKLYNKKIGSYSQYVEYYNSRDDLILPSDNNKTLGDLDLTDLTDLSDNDNDYDDDVNGVDVNDNGD